MATNDDNERGLLDGAGKSRRFVKAPDEIKKIRHKTSFVDSKNAEQSPRITAELRYDKKAQNAISPTPLTTADKIRIAAGFKQAIIRITSFGQGIQKVFNHLKYISRNFDLALEDQNGNLIKSIDESNDLLASWQALYFDGRANSRDTLHMVFSAPPGTDRVVFKSVTQSFMRNQFEGEHDYLFVAHNDTEHPHIHSVICMRSIAGKKLDPRKHYLNELRKQFAKDCRDHGILVDASRRYERGLAGKSVKSAFVQMRTKRQVIPEADRKLYQTVKDEIRDNRTVDTGEAKRAARNEAVRQSFYHSAKDLFDQGRGAIDEGARSQALNASKLLLEYAKRMPNEVSRAEYLKHVLGKRELQSAQLERISQQLNHDEREL